MAAPWTILLRRSDAQESKILRQALQCAFPGQVRVVLAETMDDILRLVVEQSADIVITDCGPTRRRHDVPHWDELQVIRHLTRRRHREVSTVVLGTERQRERGVDCIEAGAVTFIGERDRVAATVAAVERIFRSRCHGAVYFGARELVLSTEAGQVLYSHHSPQPKRRALISAFLHGKLADLSQVLDTGVFEHLALHGQSWEAMYETRDEFDLFAGSTPQLDPDLPAPGPTLSESLGLLAGQPF